jgi:hypothetical protein
MLSLTPDSIASARADDGQKHGNHAGLRAFVAVFATKLSKARIDRFADWLES